MEKGDLEDLFKELRDTLDTEEPKVGHRERFLEKLEAFNGMVQPKKKKIFWWKPLSIAASIAILIAVALPVLRTPPSLQEQVSKISPEASQTQFYFANLIEEQVKELKSESTPETKKIIDDTMVQLRKLEADYVRMEQDLLNGGNSKLILSAMITNFQTRIALLQDVLQQIENIKTLKKYDDENFTL